MRTKSFQFSVMALAATSLIALSVASSSAQAAQATFGPAPVGLAFTEDTATIETSQFTIGPAPVTTTTSPSPGGAVWGGTMTNTTTAAGASTGMTTSSQQGTAGLNGETLYFNTGSTSTSLLPRTTPTFPTSQVNSAMQSILAADPSLQAKLNSLSSTALGAASIVSLAQDPKLAANMLGKFALGDVGQIAYGLQNSSSLQQLSTTINAIGSAEALHYYTQNTQLGALTENQYWSIYHSVLKNPDYFQDNALALFASNTDLTKQLSGALGVSLQDIQSMAPQDLLGAANKYLGVDISSYGLNATQVAGLLKGDYSSLQGMAKDQLVGLLGSVNTDVISGLNMSDLTTMFNGDFSILQSMDTADLQGFMSTLDPSVFDEFGAEGLADAFGMDTQEFADALGVDIEDLADMDGAEFASLTEGFGGSGDLGDFSSIFGGGSSSGGSVISGITGGGGLGGLFGGGGSGGGSTSRGAPLVPHGG
jgi:hypothetical protein